MRVSSMANAVRAERPHTIYVQEKEVVVKSDDPYEDSVEQVDRRDCCWEEEDEDEDSGIDV